MLMKNVKKLWLPAVAVALAMGACSSDNEPGEELTVAPTLPEEVEFELTAAEKAAASRALGFQTDFFRAVNAMPDNAGKNVVVSPLSAQVLLSILANTAGQQQAAEIMAALDCNDMDAINSLAVKYQSALPMVENAVKMTLVNAMWYNNRYTVNPEPASRLGEVFGIEPVAADFNDGKAVSDKINRWAADKTNNLIREIMQPTQIRPDLLAVMANALYFSGAWANPFDAAKTEKEEFAAVDGQATVDMMKNDGMQHVMTGEAYSAVKMELGASGKFYALFVLPAEGSDINDFVETFDARTATPFKDDAVTFWLPKFKFETSDIYLNQPFAHLGMTSLNSLVETDFFMEKPEAYFDVFQKSVISFEEKGAEGAAITWNRMCMATGDPVDAPPHPVVKLNRPFLFFINEASTDACIFAGKMVKF